MVIILKYEEFLEDSNVNNFSMDYYNAKAAHCIHLHEGIEKRVAFALIKKEAIINILNYKKKVVDDWREQLIKNKHTSSLPSEEFEYINLNISSDFALEMLINEFFSHIHSIFDLVAFLLNETVLQRSIKKTEGVSYNKVIEELENNKQHLDLLEILQGIKDNDWYKYIDDFNNLAKHRYLANIESTSYLDTSEIVVNISEFERKGKHEEEEAFDVIYICFDEVLIFLNGVFSYIKKELPNINFEDRYHREDMYYKAQISTAPGSSGANAFLITGSKTYKKDDELYISIVTIDDELNRVKLNDENHVVRVFLKNRREDDLPYAYAEHVPTYKLRSRYDYIKYKVKTSSEIEKVMILDFFEPKKIYGNRLTDDINLIVNNK